MGLRGLRPQPFEGLRLLDLGTLVGLSASGLMETYLLGPCEKSPKGHDVPRSWGPGAHENKGIWSRWGGNSEPYLEGLERIKSHICSGFGISEPL